MNETVHGKFSDVGILELVTEQSRTKAPQMPPSASKHSGSLIYQFGENTCGINNRLHQRAQVRGATKYFM